MTGMRKIVSSTLVALLSIMGLVATPGAAQATRGACAYDYAWHNTVPTQALANTGCGGVLRYIDIKAAHNGKQITQRELATLHQSGFEVGLVLERWAARAKDGYGAGQVDARRANQALAELALPITTVVYLAVDFDAYSVSQVNAYVNGWVSIRPGSITGVYGSIMIVTALRGWVSYGWATYAWRNHCGPTGRSRCEWPSGDVAQVRQVKNGVTIGGEDMDRDEIMNPNWGQIGSSAPPLQLPTPSASLTPPLPSVVKNGSRGSAVTAVQGRFYDRGWSIRVDGQFGYATESVVRAFQREKGLTVDGIVGPRTWECMWTCSL